LTLPTASHPRPNVEDEIPQAFTDGPHTPFGTENADDLAGCHRIDFVDIIKNSAWSDQLGCQARRLI
jgi:hypothetical protein